MEETKDLLQIEDPSTWIKGLGLESPVKKLALELDPQYQGTDMGNTLTKDMRNILKRRTRSSPQRENFPLYLNNTSFPPPERSPSPPHKHSFSTSKESDYYYLHKILPSTLEENTQQHPIHKETRKDIGEADWGNINTSSNLLHDTLEDHMYHFMVSAYRPFLKKKYINIIRGLEVGEQTEGVKSTISNIQDLPEMNTQAMKENKPLQFLKKKIIEKKNIEAQEMEKRRLSMDILKKLEREKLEKVEIKKDLLEKFEHHHHLRTQSHVVEILNNSEGNVHSGGCVGAMERVNSNNKNFGKELQKRFSKALQKFGEKHSDEHREKRGKVHPKGLTLLNIKSHSASTDIVGGDIKHRKSTSRATEVHPQSMKDISHTTTLTPNESRTYLLDNPRSSKSPSIRGVESKQNSRETSMMSALNLSKIGDEGGRAAGGLGLGEYVDIDLIQGNGQGKGKYNVKMTQKSSVDSGRVSSKDRSFEKQPKYQHKKTISHIKAQTEEKKAQLAMLKMKRNTIIGNLSRSEINNHRKDALFKFQNKKKNIQEKEGYGKNNMHKPQKSLDSVTIREMEENKLKIQSLRKRNQMLERKIDVYDNKLHNLQEAIYQAQNTVKDNLQHMQIVENRENLLKNENIELNYKIRQYVKGIDLLISEILHENNYEELKQELFEFMKDPDETDEIKSDLDNAFLTEGYSSQSVHMHSISNIYENKLQGILQKIDPKLQIIRNIIREMGEQSTERLDMQMNDFENQISLLQEKYEKENLNIVKRYRGMGLELEAKRKLNKCQTTEKLYKRKLKELEADMSGGYGDNQRNISWYQLKEKNIEYKRKIFDLKEELFKFGVRYDELNECYSNIVKFQDSKRNQSELSLDYDNIQGESMAMDHIYSMVKENSGFKDKLLNKLSETCQSLNKSNLLSFMSLSNEEESKSP